MNLTNVYSIKWVIRHIVCIPSYLLFHVLPVYKLGLRVTHMNYHDTRMTLVAKVLFPGVCIILFDFMYFDCTILSVLFTYVWHVFNYRDIYQAATKNTFPKLAKASRAIDKYRHINVSQIRSRAVLYSLGLSLRDRTAAMLNMEKRPVR